jgi:putative adhesin
MKLWVVLAVAGLFFSFAGTTPAYKAKKESNGAETPGGKVQRSIPVSPEVTVTLCVASGTLRVRGWDKNELRVTSSDAGQIELRRLDKGKDPTTPAWRIDVMVLDPSAKANAKLDCQALADVDMEVPTGATVQVQTRDGDISIVGVSAAYAGSQNGNIVIERAAKIVEAGSVGGSISLKDSSGRVNLSSAGGIVVVANVKPASAEDTFEVGTVSGDIQLDRVSVPKVMAKTVNGNVTMTGPLARSGNYAFTNMAGDVILALPHDASFQLNAKVSGKRDIVSDFPLKYVEMPPPPPAKPGTPTAKPGAEPAPKSGAVGKPGTAVPAAPKSPVVKGHPPQTGPIITPVPVERPTVVPYVLRRLTAVCGSGDATISVASFGGTVRLKKI